MPLVKISSRSSSPSASINPIYILGLAIAGAIVIGVSSWFILKMVRKRAAKRDSEENIGATFLSVRGIVRDDNVTEKNPGFVLTIYLVNVVH
jgi:hypothetical protein